MRDSIYRPKRAPVVDFVIIKTMMDIKDFLTKEFIEQNTIPSNVAYGKAYITAAAVFPLPGECEDKIYVLI